MFRAQVLVKKKTSSTIAGFLIFFPRKFEPGWQKGDRSLDPMWQTVVIDTFFVFWSFLVAEQNFNFRFQHPCYKRGAHQRARVRRNPRVTVKTDNLVPFGFVHKRSGNEITGTDSSLRSQNAEGIVFKRNGTSCIQRSWWQNYNVKVEKFAIWSHTIWCDYNTTSTTPSSEESHGNEKKVW